MSTTLWRADFIDMAGRVAIGDRREWPPFPAGRDYVITFPADGSIAARQRAFRFAREAGLKNPWLGELLEVTPEPGSMADFRMPPWATRIQIEFSNDAYACGAYTRKGTPCRWVAVLRLTLLDGSVVEHCRTHARMLVLDRGPEEARYREWRKTV